MENYGLSNHQIKFAKLKIEKNKKFLYDNGVHVDNKIIPFSDFVCNSYMNSDRYIAELNHRAWSIYDYAKEKDLKIYFSLLLCPLFGTLKKLLKRKLVNNPFFGGRKILLILSTL